jgi:ribosomal protein S18 acetylase RimI-like enzyme
MIRASLQDKDLMISILSKAFMEEKSVNYMIKHDEKKNSRVCALVSYSIDVCNMFGELWLSDNREACALILYHSQVKTNIKTILLDLKFVTRVCGFGGALKMLKWATMLKKTMPAKDITYLWFIGVNPVHQHKGTGSRLLTEILEQSERKAMPVYMETSTIENLPWYDKYGFEIYKKRDLGYQLFFLRREVENGD